MTQDRIECGDCLEGIDRRGFLQTLGATAATMTAGGILLPGSAQAAPTPKSAAETAVKALYETLTPEQKKAICFDWDHKDERGLLRTHVSNNWHITKPTIDSDFFTAKQKSLAFDVFKGIFNPDWHQRLLKQLKDDNNGKPFGADQNLAFFGVPGEGKFELVMTGRHMTCRADGNSEKHVALGGPIFHGHAAQGFNEKAGHPGNVFWHQAQEANKVFTILGEKQKEKAMVARRPAESAVSFRGKEGVIPGLPITEMSSDQKDAMKKVLMTLVEPYRKEDQDEIAECLKAQGGLEACRLTFYREGSLGDKETPWDNWRLEGPAFVWYFRGTPHVHIWINVADSPSVVLNARG